ncbi:MAG TPA: YigZ family protein [Thermoanaerobacterales bacterium]|jgi:uncharacterized YigZ family protein|nr:YigZ family protein [Thermoanaerobacterales bacterium]
MSKDEFLTVNKPSESMYVVKKSKFIANVVPIKNNNEAEKHLEQFRKKYWDATHNVYAYVLGLNDEIQKFSDDGEPSGTAGRPVLEVVKSKEVKNVLVVVTRYFGGILLGAGGLVRAYSESASIGLKNSNIIRRIKSNAYEITTDYSMLGRLQWEMNEKNIIIKDIDYTEKVTMTVYVPESYNLDLEQFILNITSGNSVVKCIGNYYINQSDS